MPTSKRSWIVHIQGLEHIFALRGPLTVENSSKFDRALLESFRPIMILGALFTGKPSLMSSNEWCATTKTHEFMARPELFRTSIPSPDISFLLSVLAQLPGLLMERDRCLRLAKTEQSARTYGNILCVRFAQLWRELKTWKEMWDLNHQKSVYKIVPSSGTCSISIRSWTYAFSFADIKVAEAFVIYQVVVILLAGISLQLCEPGLSLSYPTLGGFDSLSECSLISDIEMSAMNICRSVESHFQLYQTSQGQPDFYLLFPMHVARQAFNNLGWLFELAWLSGLFDMVLPKITMGLWTDLDISDKVVGTYIGQFGKNRSNSADISS